MCSYFVHSLCKSTVMEIFNRIIAIIRRGKGGNDSDTIITISKYKHTFNWSETEVSWLAGFVVPLRHIFASLLSRTFLLIIMQKLCLYRNRFHAGNSPNWVCGGRLESGWLVVHGIWSSTWSTSAPQPRILSSSCIKWIFYCTKNRSRLLMTLLARVIADRR